MKNNSDMDVINEHLESAVERMPTTIEVVKKLAEGSKAERISVTLARQIEPRQRLESPARDHTFYSLEGFAQYLNGCASSNLVILADAETGRMTATLDEDQSEGFETITFEPRLHPLYAPWHQVYGKPTPIKELARFIMANRRTVAEPEDLLHDLSQITVSRHVTINDGTGPHSLNGVMVETKIQKTERTELAVDLPDEIILEVPIFLEGKPCSIDVDLMLEAQEDGTVYATLTSSDAEHKRILAIAAMPSCPWARSTTPTGSTCVKAGLQRLERNGIR